MNASRKLLVVDDDPVVRKSFNWVLSSKGYAVITAKNGEEALRKLEMIEGSAPDALATPAAVVEAVVLPAAAEVPLAESAVPVSALKNIILFFASIVFFPFIGLAAIAAPFIGLVCLACFPFIRLAMLAWIGSRAAVAAGARRMRPVIELAVLASMGRQVVVEPVPNEEWIDSNT